MKTNKAINQINQTKIRVTVAFVAKFMGRCSGKIWFGHHYFATKGASSLLLVSLFNS
jgi:hypothetical protein